MTRCALLLSLLEDAGERGITTSEILEAGVGSRYGARLMELRKAGHRITSERVREGSWRYVLLDVEVGGESTGEVVNPQTHGSTADLSAEVLTPQQAAIAHYVNQGYPMTEVGRLVGCSPSQVSDQVRFIRKKGVEVRLTRATEVRIPMQAEALKLFESAA